MISDELKEIIDKIKDQGKMRFLEAATEEQISQFEKENEIQLPAQYREWLQYADGGELYLPAGVQLYGVAHKPLINIEDNDRPDDNYIIVGALSSGEPVLFKKDEEKFYIFNHESQELDDDLTYDDFVTLLNDLYDLLGIGE
ncbi:SMI1/KNR4 family protein [Sporofaciens musculi]|uniref:SMI1/KNR4 family protein n=1 Tax=Sporofaciens musculi TaxID=2681861 RepID=UPI0025706151|nr:SMI1/KNR4 family protein [Sporofaciens musculi]